VVTVARIQSGTTSNVIPESAELLGTVRTVSPKTRAAVLDEVRRVAEGVASAHGAEAEVDLVEGYPVTVNDPGAADFALETAAALLGEKATITMTNPVMGAEDWSYVLEEVPGAMAFLGTRPEGGGHVAPNHSNRMILDESAMAAGIGTYAAVALRWLGAARPE
jgi:hippurate hydrolase